MSYNLTQLQGVTGVYDLIVYANDATGNIFGTLMLVAVFIIMLMSLKRYDFDNAFMVSSFVCGIISTIMFYANMVTMVPVLFLWAVFLVTTLYIFMIKKD